MDGMATRSAGCLTVVLRPGRSPPKDSPIRPGSHIAKQSFGTGPPRPRAGACTCSFDDRAEKSYHGAVEGCLSRDQFMPT